ncbi:HAD-like protein [Gymnopus androsaceus JB14]|uniref:HAD-like protein n=1 Tax=Gymnopus androsaceus JB14 TaxID=1447944 RepID=A0A6A4IRX5_9AGAR|nr:HAD-like protein [Gymnopus androsaceus JB14]
MSPRVGLVTFDILHTLITPRWPIHVQYAMEFEPYLGTLDPNCIKSSFKTGGSQSWWRDVIKRTALGAGANHEALESSLRYIVPNLMERFGSGKGYREFEDAIPTIRALHERQIQTAVISNSDSRSHSVLLALKFPEYMSPVVLSEEEGIEKPAREIFLRALERVNSIRGECLRADQCLHVGDELDADYRGAINAGMKALLLRRPGPEGEQAHVEANEDLQDVKVIQGLDRILDYTE